MALTPKRLARKRVENALRYGRLTKPDLCEGCLSRRAKVAHHVTYEASGLDIVWLCRSCHTHEHKRLRRDLSPAFRSLVSKAPPHPS